MGDSNWLCPHCRVALVNERPWPNYGSLADCPRCNSTATRRFSTAAEREQRLRLAFNEAVLDRDVGPAARWVRAFEVVAQAYKRESNFAGAKACEDTAVELKALELAARRETLARIPAARQRAACAGALS